MVDQKIGRFSTKTKSVKWTAVAHSYLLDTARVNATTLYMLATGKKEETFMIGWDLVKAMVVPHMKTRPLVGLHESLVSKINNFLQEVETPAPMPSTSGASGRFSSQGPKRRCNICISTSKGPGYKAAKDLIHKVGTQCQNCESPVCKEHFILRCRQCQ